MINILHIAVDVGSNGAIAVSEPSGMVSVYQINKRNSSEILRDIYENAKAKNYEMKAIVEAVHATPQMGVSSAFTFGKNFGGIIEVLRFAKIPFETVTPQIWQKVYSLPLPPKKKDYSTPEAFKRAKALYKVHHKKDLYQKAKDLFPSICKSEDRADALLILNYFLKGK